MDYVFGLSMVLALMIRDVTLCNTQGVTQCAQSTDFSTLSDPQKACLEWKKFEECVSPFSEACAENPTYVSFYNNMKILKSNCGGSSGDSCDVMGLQKCMSVVESSQNENSGLEETCKVLPEFLQCIDPLRKACDNGNQLYNNIKGSIADFERKCAGVSSECNILEASKCFGSFKMPENMQSMSAQDIQTMCTSIRAVKSCIEPYKSACAADQSFTGMLGGMTQAAMLCGDSGCNIIKCFSDAGIAMDSTKGGSPNISCNSYMSLKTCVESQESACQQNQIYTGVQESLKQAELMCGSPGCNIDECNIDFSFPNGIPSKSKYDTGCTALKAAIPCLESKSECPNLKALGSTSMTQAYKRFCEDAMLKKGLETHKMCLRNATINAKCNKYLSPTMSDSGMTEETEKEECQRIGDYAMCAKKATSVCDNEEAMNFAAETARKILFLKSRREGGIECATGSGIAASPALWIVFSAAMMVLAANFP